MSHLSWLIQNTRAFDQEIEGALHSSYYNSIKFRSGGTRTAPGAC
jgi:hypothetical protein